MSYDVAIVGGGPVGLFLACELRLHGVRTVVLERRTEIDQTIKAGGVTGRGADILARRNVVDLLGDLPDAGLMRPRPVGDGSVPGAARSKAPVVGHFAGLWILRGGAHSGGARSGGAPLLVPQQVLESALEKHATEVGAVVRRGHALTRLDQDDHGVVLTVEGPEGPYELRAGWLVGCDGGRSAIRKMTGIAFPGLDGVTTGYQALAEFDDPDFFPFGWHRTAHGMMARGPLRERVLTVEFDGPPVDRSAPVSREELQASVRRQSGTEVTITTVHTATRFTDNTRQADTYRIGRVLLAGDAAHVHPPFGGQGLALGLGDAVNLGWKLAAEVAGWAPDGLLDTYLTERHPAAARVLHTTRAQVALMAPGPRVDALRDVFAALAETDEANRLLTDLMSDRDLRYEVDVEHRLAGRYCPDLPLTVHGTATSVAALSPSGRPLLLDLDDHTGVRDAVRPWADRIEVVRARSDDAPAAAMLVRPDGYVAWAGEDVGGLREACARWFGAPRE
ncbi:FAD-dependent monooxygenase [Actinoallomurus spadix]|uniref:FAD-dependent monooxygenase n=1 Tax=Actinoallomurus spadix TaxID=79912 RepID=A0ABN0WUV6_9ACTN|nr:FAD-dependent monooxygenase [Actinoallomurus spadix]MCO5986493.1 FAD-dependent monooxygenase [Actinoallomurus spadix]